MELLGSISLSGARGSPGEGGPEFFQAVTSIGRTETVVAILCFPEQCAETVHINSVWDA